MDDSFIFQIDDLNFIGYDTQQLSMLCDHHILRRTRYPKLVIVLMDHPYFKEWISKNNVSTELDFTIQNIIKGIRQYAFNFQGNLVHSSINLNDEEFWKYIVDSFMMSSPCPSSSSSSSSRNNIKTMKKKERSYWV